MRVIPDFLPTNPIAIGLFPVSQKEAQKTHALQKE
jgi:hypothetical protein